MYMRTLTWRRLVPGLVTLAVLIATAVAILVYARVGALHGATVRYHLLAEEATGLRRGSDVWLAGVRVGRIEAIRFRPVTTDTLHRLALDVDVLDRYRPWIRRDTRATIRSGGRMLSDPVVWLLPGSPESPVLAAGGTLAVQPLPEREALAPMMDSAALAFDALSRDLVRLRAAAHGAAARWHGAVDDPRWGVDALEHRMHDLEERIAIGHGDGEVDPLQRVRRVMSLADSLLDLFTNVAGDSGSPAVQSARRQQRDAMADIQRQLERIRAQLATADGTAGRFQRDSALAYGMARVDSAMAQLMEDMHKHPLRYWPF